MGGLFGDGWWWKDCLNFCGNWHYNIFGRIVSRSKVNSYILGLDCLVMGGDEQTVLNFSRTGITNFLDGLFRGVNSYFGDWHQVNFWLVVS